MSKLLGRPSGSRLQPEWNRENGNGYALPVPACGRLPRILVLSVSVGHGHLRAAEAIELAVRRLLPDAYVRSIDVLSLSTAVFRHCYGQMYLNLIGQAPQVIGFIYNLMDQPVQLKHSRWERLRVSLEKMSMRPFVRLLTSEPWDLVIHTHFLPAEIVASLRRQGRISTPHVMVITDFETHRMWINQPCEHYFTATAEAALYLECFGVPRRDVTPVGIPIHPVFAEAKPRAACLLRHGLKGDRPIVLQLAGGYGVGPLDTIYRALLDVEAPLEIVAVAGRNAKVKQRLEAVATPPRHRVKVLGFTDQIDELMAVADLVMTKPGGLTTSEALARGAGIVIVNPVPGQEERNSDYLLENGAAIKVNHIATLAHKVGALLADRDWLAGVKANARRLARPRAAFDVVERSLALLPNGVRGQGSGVRGRRPPTPLPAG